MDNLSSGLVEKMRTCALCTNEFKLQFWMRSHASRSFAMVYFCMWFDHSIHHELAIHAATHWTMAE
jgi:hypothetical protein